MATALRIDPSVDDMSVADFFCGAGGSSQGLEDAGVPVSLAVNHWQLAIDTHARNFPATRHDRADLSTMDPRRYPRTRLAWFSPSCTNHSLAKGVTRRKQQADLWGDFDPDPAAERSRATMWDVVRFAEAHHYDAIIVENVVEAREWVFWDSWLHALTVAMDYDYRCVYMNSMHAHPTPQSRDRMYVVFWRRHLPAPDLDIRPSAYCHACARDVRAVQAWKNPQRRYGKYRTQYVYVCPDCTQRVEPYYFAAFNAIDWALPIERVGDRKHPLKPKTRERIAAGIQKYGGDALLFTTDQSHVHRNIKRLLGEPTMTMTTATTTGVALPSAQPFVLAPGSYGRAQGVYEKGLPTQVTQATPMMVVPPFLIDAGGSWQRDASDVLAAPYPAQTTKRQPGLVVPFLAEVGHGGPHNAGRIKAISDPLPAIHTMGGVGAVLVPLSHGQYGGRAHMVADPMPTQTTRQEIGVAIAPFLAQLRTHMGAQGVDDALTTITAGGTHHALVNVPRAFLTSYYGSDTSAHSLIDALGTQPTLDRHALVQAYGALPDVDDCYFRVLKPHEIKLAMAFRREYVVLGTSREQIRQLGNAVTPPAARELIARVRAILER